MPSQVTNFQCPTCTGPLHYVGKSGRLECEYCGNSFSVQKIEALYGEKIEEAQLAAQAAGNEAQDNEWNCTAGEDWGSEAANLKTYSCPSCGAELVCDQTTAATSCPYCGNPSIVPGQFHGMLKPDYILPLRLDKQAAVTALKNYYKGKHLLPKAFADSNHIEEIKGVYVPFWLFNGEAEADLRFTATRSRSYRHGDQLITEVDHFLLRRAGTVQFSRIPVDASSKMPDKKRRQNPHEACQHHQSDTSLFKLLDQGLFKRLTALIFLAIHADSPDTSLPGSLQGKGLRLVREDYGNFGLHLTAVNGINDGLKICSPS